MNFLDRVKDKSRQLGEQVAEAAAKAKAKAAAAKERTPESRYKTTSSPQLVCNFITFMQQHFENLYA